MEIQYDNPNEVGMTGLLECPPAITACTKRKSYCCWVRISLYEAFMPQNNTIVQVDIKANRLGRRAKIKMGLCGDVKDTFTGTAPFDPSENE